MSGTGGRGLLVIGHGSRRDEANDTVREVAQALATDGGFTAVRPAFLEMVTPGIADAYGALVALGCTELVVHPFFLFAGNHTTRDIPAALDEARQAHPGTSWRLTAPLGLHPGVLAAARDRIEAETG